MKPKVKKFLEEAKKIIEKQKKEGYKEGYSADESYGKDVK